MNPKSQSALSNEAALLFARLPKLRQWLFGHEWVVVCGILIIGCGAWAFIKLAEKVLAGETQAFDEWMLLSLRKSSDPAQPFGPPWVAEVARDITALGGIAVLAIVTGGVCGYLLLDHKLSAAVFVLAATCSGLVVNVGLKLLVDRPRPNVVPHLSQTMTTSFPSGHSMMSAVVYLTLGALMSRFVAKQRLKLYFLTLAVMLTLLTGVSRVLMGVHYPTDVLAGWSAGCVWASLCWLVARQLQRRGKIESAAQSG